MGNQEEGGYVTALMQAGLSLQDHASTYVLMQCAHTHTRYNAEVYIEILMGK